MASQNIAALVSLSPHSITKQLNSGVPLASKNNSALISPDYHKAAKP
jgi:hypothetical protein